MTSDLASRSACRPPRWRVDQHRRQHLEHVVLQDVADRARAVVETAPVGDVESLRHSDLDAVHVVAIEQRLDDAVGEPCEQDVLHRVQPQPVVDPVDGVLREDGVHRRVELPGALQVRTERLLDHHPGVRGQTRLVDAFRDRPEQRRWHLQVEQRRPGRQLAGQRAVGGVVREVPVDVFQQPQHLVGRVPGGVDVVVPQRLGGVGTELVHAPTALGHPHNRNVKNAALDQPDQGRERLEFGQVTRRAEDDQCPNPRRSHADSFPSMKCRSGASRSGPAR